MMEIAHLKHIENPGVNAGSYYSDNYAVRTLNFMGYNTITKSAVVHYKLKLGKGAYLLDAVQVASNIGLARGDLYNMTDQKYELIGVPTDTAVNTPIITRGLFNITATKEFELRLWGKTTRATIGLGKAANFGKQQEIYANVIVAKL